VNSSRRERHRRTTADDIQPLIGRLVAACLADQRVIALLLYGSHAAGEADAFSDLDIGLVTTDAAHDDVVAHLEELVRAVGEPLFCEHFGEPANLHVIYADGAALELIVTAEAELSIDGPHRVLFDRTGVVPRSRRRRRRQEDLDAAREVVRRLVVWFWHDVEHFVAAFGRGQAWWAYGQLDVLRGVCLDLARLASGVEVEPGEAYWKVDEALSAECLEALEDTVVPLEPGPMLDAARALVRSYRELAPGLAAAHGIVYPLELDRLVSGRLARLTERETGQP
jgi:predicted nucleotidyltransferase